jgi:hypothetical protein
LLAIIDGLLAEMTVVPVAALTPVLAESEIALRDTVASRNGSIRDAHVLALAHSVEADINEIDMDLLEQVDDQILKDIGVSAAGHRLRIRSAIAKMIAREDLSAISSISKTWGRKTSKASPGRCELG